MNRPSSSHPTRRLVLVELLLLTGLTSCGAEEPAGDGGPPDVPGEAAGRRRQTLLLDSLLEDRIEADWDARDVTVPELALAVEDLERVTEDDEVIVLRLPAPPAVDTEGRPLTGWVSDSGGTRIDDGVRIVRGEREIPFRKLRAFGGYKRNRDLDGTQGVAIELDAEVTFPLRRFGQAQLVRVHAAPFGVRHGAPVVEVLLDGQLLATLRWAREMRTLPRFELGPRLGTQQITFRFRELGGEGGGLVLRRLIVTEQDRAPLAVIHREIVDRVGRVHYPARPPGTLFELPGADDQEPAWNRPMVFSRGEAALVTVPGTDARISVADRTVATAGAQTEVSLGRVEPGVVPLSIAARTPWSSAWLIQPQAALQELDGFLRGVRDDRDRTLYRAHVQIGDVTAWSLLAFADHRFEFPIEKGEEIPEALEFELGAIDLASREVDTFPVERVVRVDLVARLVDGGEEEIASIELGAFSPWQPQRHLLPVDTTSIAVRVHGAGQAPIASRTLVPVLAEPRVVHAPAADVPPNVLIYMIDTLRADRLGCYGAERPISPSLDALARESILFENAHAQAPWTRPSVATLFTGLFYSFHGAGKFSGLGPDVATIAELLRGEQYFTAAFLSNAQIHSRGLLFEQGFAHFEAVETRAGDARAEEVHEAVERWLDRSPDRPFFAFVHTIDPHAPYDPPASVAGRFQDASYAGPLRPDMTMARTLATMQLTEEDRRRLRDLYDEEVAYADQEFGRLVEGLRERGIWANTLVVVLSDHGEEFYEHGDVGHGGRLWQELLHVPLLIKPAGSSGPRGIRVDQRVRVADVSPTILAMLGIPAPATLQGVDLVPTWRSQLRELDVIAEEEPGFRTMIRGDLKVIETLQEDGTSGSLALFHLGRDPGEQIDLASERDREARRLRDLLLRRFGDDIGRGIVPRQGAQGIEWSDRDLEALRKLGYLDDGD